MLTIHSQFYFKKSPMDFKNSSGKMIETALQQCHKNRAD